MNFIGLTCELTRANEKHLHQIILKVIAKEETPKSIYRVEWANILCVD